MGRLARMAQYRSPRPQGGCNFPLIAFVALSHVSNKKHSIEFTVISGNNGYKDGPVAMGSGAPS